MPRAYLIVLSSLLSLLAAPACLASEILQQAQACAAHADSDARLACYDGLFRADATQTKAAQSKQFGLEQIERERAPIAPRDELESLSARVTKISRRSRDELLIQLDNDQIWAQTAARYLTLKEGDLVTVRRLRLGGYVLVTEGGASTRVKRIR